MEAPEFRSQALCEKIVPHVTVDAITSICNAFDSKGFLLSVVEKTKESARMGFRIIMKLSVARTLSFYISNDGEKDECLYLTLRRYG